MEKANVRLLKVGSCKHCERIARKNGSIKNVNFPMIIGLISDPVKGNILFDTGYSQHFFDCTYKYPNKLYAKTTPVTLLENERIEVLLKKENLTCNDINYVIISHFHADHISGLKLFKNAKYICSKAGFLDFKKRQGINALRKGYLKDLLPNDFEDRVVFGEDLKEIILSEEIDPFKKAFLFSDNMQLIKLCGHAKGQIGLLVDNTYFFIADTCWFEDTYKNLDFPSLLTYFIFEDKNKYRENILKINKLYNKNKNINIIPSHCNKTYTRLKEIRNV